MKSHEATCPNCGDTFKVPCDTPRHNPRGRGYHAADEITLGPLHVDIMDVLKEKSAYAYMSGLTLVQVHREVEVLRNIRVAEAANKLEKLDLRVPKLQTVSGRLSDLQGKGMISCVPTDVELTENLLHVFDYPQKPKWYIVDGPAAGKWSLHPRLEAFAKKPPSLGARV